MEKTGGNILIKKQTMITKNKADIKDQYEIEEKKVRVKRGNSDAVGKWNLWCCLFCQT